MPLRALVPWLLLLLQVGPALASPEGHRAAIDMGSSGIKMLIVDAQGRVVRDEKIGSSLGKDLGPDRLLPRKNRQRALKTLRRFIAKAARYGIAPAEIEVIATAAVRNARGTPSAAARAAGRLTGEEFMKKEVQEGLGLTRARILSGREEAVLGHKGALLGVDGLDDVRFIVLDTGGGSHQAILGTRSKVIRAGSVQVGSNVVAEKILVDGKGAPLDVLSPKDLGAAQRRMAAQTPKLPASIRSQRAQPVLTGGLAKYLHHYFREDRVTPVEVEALRAQVAALPRGKVRSKFVGRDVDGGRFSRREKRLLGLHKAGDKGGDYGGKLPAKLTLLLQMMSVLKAKDVYLSQTDARHAVLREAPARPRLPRR